MENANGNRVRALITGASSGIGKELAQIFAQHGHSLVLVARNTQRLEDLAYQLRQTHGVKVAVIGKDFAAPAAAQELYDAVSAAGTQIDVLVNNAGFGAHGAFVTTDARVELEMIQVNLVALTLLTKLFLRGMVERGTGRILNVASTAAFVPLPMAGVYGATKAYVLSLSEALAEELKGSGVTVTALCPGPTATEFFERGGMAGIRLQARAMSARTVAETGYRAMMRGQTMVVSGLANKAMVQSLRFSPRSAVAKLSKVMMSEGGAEGRSAVGSPKA